MEFFEAWKNLKEIPTQIDEAIKPADKIKIIVDVFVEQQGEINEDIVLGNPEDKYDDQTLEDWYNFASNIEGIIEKQFIVQNISLSKNIESLSEYIDFYRKDENGNRIKGLIDLRLSDHKQTTNARIIRKKHASKIDSDYRLVSIIVNGKRFTNYEDALNAIEFLLNNLKEIKEEISSKDRIKITVKVPGPHGREETESYIYNSLEDAKEAFKEFDEDDIISISGSSIEQLREGTQYKRVAKYKEFDNGHVLFKYEKISDEEAEEKAKKASMKDPEDIYYVHYDDIMNPSSDTRWINGKSYNYDQVTIRDNKPVILSEATSDQKDHNNLKYELKDFISDQITNALDNIAIVFASKNSQYDPLWANDNIHSSSADEVYKGIEILTNAVTRDLLIYAPKSIKESQENSNSKQILQDKIYKIENDLNVEIDSIGDNKYAFDYIYYLKRGESPAVNKVLQKAKETLLSKSDLFKDHAKITYFNTYAVEGSMYGIRVQFELNFDSNSLIEDVHSSIIEWSDLNKAPHGSYYYGKVDGNARKGTCKFFLNWIGINKPHLQCDVAHPYDDSDYHWARSFDVTEDNFKDETLKRNWKVYDMQIPNKPIDFTGSIIEVLSYIQKVLDKEVKPHMVYEGQNIDNFYHGEKQDKNVNYGIDVNKFLDNCYASGGNWTSMLLSGIKNLFPDYYEAMPDKKYSWEEVIYILNNDLGIKTDN